MNEGTPPRPGRLASLLRWRTPAKWLFGVLLALDVFVLLFVLSLANVTAEGASVRALRHSVAILTEIDGYLDEHYAGIRDLATSGDTRAVELPDFPFAVEVTSEEIAAGDRASFRALLLDRSAELVREEGVAAMREGRAAEVSFFSTQGAIRTGMDFVRPTPHRALNVLTIIYAAGAGVLAAGLLLSGRGYGRLLGLGLSVLVAALLFLILAIAVRFALRVTADGADDYVAHEFLTLGQELTWAPIRNGIIFSVGSALVLVSGLALARWSDTRRAA